MFSWHSFHIEAFLGETVHQKTLIGAIHELHTYHQRKHRQGTHLLRHVRQAKHRQKGMAQAAF